MKKRLLALVMVLVLMLGAVSSALAAKPTATILKASKNQVVKAGKSISFDFKLNSGSYKKKAGAYRAKLGIVISKGSDLMGRASWVWSGTQVYRCKASIRKTAPLGKYSLKYTTYYRSSGFADWKKAKTQSTKFTVKK